MSVCQKYRTIEEEHVCMDSIEWETLFTYRCETEDGCVLLVDPGLHWDIWIPDELVDLLDPLMPGTVGSDSPAPDVETAKALALAKYQELKQEWEQRKAEESLG